MSHGGRRAGAGRKPHTLDELQIRGAFRPRRHGHLVGLSPTGARASQEYQRGATAHQMAPAAGWAADPALLQGLGREAADFVARTCADYAISNTDALLVVAAARALDRMLIFQRVVDADGALFHGGPHPLLRPLAAEQRSFLATLRQLELEK